MLSDRFPVLLLPMRLEVRFMDEVGELWVRIFPDDVAIESHDATLSVDEALAGLGYRHAIEFGTAEPNTKEQRQKDAWRELVKKLSVERAAWIIKEIRQEKYEIYLSQYKTLKLENRLMVLSARLRKDLALEDRDFPARAVSRVLPDRFVVSVYNREERRIYQEEGKPVPSEVFLMAPSNSDLAKHSKEEKILEFFNEVQTPQDLRVRVARFFSLPEIDKEKIQRLAQKTLDLRDAAGFRFQEIADLERIWRQSDLDPEETFDDLLDTLFGVFVSQSSVSDVDQETKKVRVLEFFNEIVIVRADIVEPILNFFGVARGRRAEIQRLAQQTIDVRDAAGFQLREIADVERIWTQNFLDPDHTFDDIIDTLFGVFLEQIEFGNGMLGPGTRWLEDFETAVQMGLGVKIVLNETGVVDQPPFSKIIAVGIKSSINEQQSSELLEQLIDSHHYSNGLAFLEPGTPTNNTEKSESGHSESQEDPEKSYAVEFQGHRGWDQLPADPQNKR